MLLLVQSYAPDKASYINCLELSPNQLASIFEVGSFSYWFNKPWFHTAGRLAVVFIIPFSWGSQLGAYHALSSNFSDAVAGEKEDFYKGSLSLPIFFTLLLFCLFSLLYFCLHLFIKNTKKLVPLELLFLLVCF
jgi:hypothetical protein